MGAQLCSCRGSFSEGVRARWRKKPAIHRCKSDYLTMHRACKTSTGRRLAAQPPAGLLLVCYRPLADLHFIFGLTIGFSPIAHGGWAKNQGESRGQTPRPLKQNKLMTRLVWMPQLGYEKCCPVLARRWSGTGFCPTGLLQTLIDGTWDDPAIIPSARARKELELLFRASIDEVRMGL